jgi:uncharacterized protein (DUF1501 family)
MITRRNFLWCAGAGVGAMLVGPRIAFASVASERRFVFVIQRGAADGLNIVVPYADPAYASLRGALAIDPSTATKLDGTFALHPSLVETAKMYAAQQALFVHAVASPYRDRSHFDGQNVLETGGTAPYQIKDGWLNRLVSMLPASRANAIALAPTVPLALRGRAEVHRTHRPRCRKHPTICSCASRNSMPATRSFMRSGALRWMPAGSPPMPARVRTRQASASSLRASWAAATARASR